MRYCNVCVHKFIYATAYSHNVSLSKCIAIFSPHAGMGRHGQIKVQGMVIHGCIVALQSPRRDGPTWPSQAHCIVKHGCIIAFSPDGDAVPTGMGLRGQYCSLYKQSVRDGICKSTASKGAGAWST